MLHKTLSAAVYGMDANIIQVEVDCSAIECDPHHFHTVGLPDAAARESRDRVRAEQLRLRHPAHANHHQPGPRRHQYGRFRIRSSSGPRPGRSLRRPHQKGNPRLPFLRRTLSRRRFAQCSRCSPHRHRSPGTEDLPHGCPRSERQRSRHGWWRIGLSRSLPAQSHPLHQLGQRHPDCKDVRGRQAAKRAVEIPAPATTSLSGSDRLAPARPCWPNACRRSSLHSPSTRRWRQPSFTARACSTSRPGEAKETPSPPAEEAEPGGGSETILFSGGA
jgi:hypothetical protein